jgi:hypothetical protein
MGEKGAKYIDRSPNRAFQSRLFLEISGPSQHAFLLSKNGI